MKAAVFEKEGVLAVKKVPRPEIVKDDDVIIEVELCSICGTDVHIMSIPQDTKQLPAPFWDMSWWGKSWKPETR